MLLRLCQLKSLILLLIIVQLSSCTLRRDEPSSSELLNTFPNKWFSVSKNHSLISQQGVPASHLYFDSTPDFLNDDREVNVLIATPENSEHAYSIDLSSGQRYYTHSFCKQNDIWNEYALGVNKPPFTVAYIPRVLDQLGDPQKVIVFSKRKSFIDDPGRTYQKVRLVGAYVEQICPDGNCLGKSNWLSKLVFLGVDSQDQHFSRVKSAQDLKHAINWNHSKAVLGNMEGRNFIGDLMYASTRIGELIEYEDAFDYFKKRSIFLTDTELKKIQKGCYALYDRLWEEVGKTRQEDKPAMTMQELNTKVKLIESLKKQKIPVGFAARFRAFTKNYFKEITTCEKFVYHGNINQDREKFWFLSHLAIFYRLHREGYFFDCRNKVWQRNVLNEKGSPMYDLVRDIDLCKEAEIDQAMDYLPNFLTGLKSEKEYYKFIDYDNQTYGSHQKMYTWVKVKSRKFDCSNDPNTKIKNELKVFPEDVTWKERNIKDIADKNKIIY